MLQIAFVGAITGSYVDFTSAQHASLKMVAERTGKSVSTDQVEGIVDGMRSLPAHPDVAPALRRLKEGGFRRVTLTNSSLFVARSQVENAGLTDLIDDVLSADEVNQLKPGPRPYHLVADRLGVQIGQVRLVSAHWWDNAGALASGAKSAFVARPGAVLSSLGGYPDIVGPDLLAVADQLLN